MVFDQTVNIPAAGFDFVYTPAESGEYEIRVSGPDAEHGFSKNFYAFGWGYTTNTSFEVNTEGQVDMQADKDEYQVGDKAKILFKTPFNGKLLVTIETDGLLEHRYLTTDKKARCSRSRSNRTCCPTSMSAQLCSVRWTMARSR